MSKLDREQIVDVAMEVIADGGEAALSMRALATRLRVTPMALYRHFADRDGLLLAVVGRVSERIVFPAPVEDPVDRAVATALCLHDFLVAHPWMIRLISTGRLASPAGLRFPEEFLSCGFAAGLDEGRAFLFYRQMFAAVLGQATVTHARRGSTGPVDVGVRLGLDGSVPVVAGLVERWAELDATASAAAVLRTAASVLRTPSPEEST
ncbi:helix-turn-helix domain-containing protein [Actinosynnema sp. NPDC020468]|uniref:TetR/AcrR family transcriptional regulator n=1 Tax=Actinosynnema sp. NPDC020468 TaxID=3154488 RepID=UPI0033C366CB